MLIRSMRYYLLSFKSIVDNVSCISWRVKFNLA